MLRKNIEINKMYTVKFDDGSTQENCYFDGTVWWEAVLDDDGGYDAWVIKDKIIVDIVTEPYKGE